MSALSHGVASSGIGVGGNYVQIPGLRWVGIKCHSWREEECVRASELTEFIRVFWADRGDNCISESRDQLWPRLIDEICNVGPALAFAWRLRGVLCEALVEVDGYSLEFLDNVCSRGYVGVRQGIRDVYAREGYEAIDSLRWICQAHPGNAGEGEEGFRQSRRGYGQPE